jgi:membrane protein
MNFKEFNIWKNLWQAFKDFFKENGSDKSSVLAYYSILSSLFLLTFFTFLFTRFLGDPDIALKSIYPFSPDFFSKISPDIFKRAEDISTRLREVGLIGILLSMVLGFLVFKKVIQYVNEMFFIQLKKGFFMSRIKEFSLLFFLGLLVLISFFLTGLISTINSLILQNQYIAAHINPEFLEALNNFFIKYLLPLGITLVIFFILYKYIPERKIYFKSALISAVISSLFWEVAKRVYAYYLVHVSLIGQIKGPIIATILFGLWMELSMGIMLYGAKLTYIFEKERNDRLRNN